MNIICLFEQKLDTSRLKMNTYIGFVEPSYGGNHINECEFKISQSNLEDYNIPVFKTYSEAHKFVHLKYMSEKDYNQTF